MRLREKNEEAKGSRKWIFTLEFSYRLDIKVEIIPFFCDRERHGRNLSAQMSVAFTNARGCRIIYTFLINFLRAKSESYNNGAIEL